MFSGRRISIIGLRGTDVPRAVCVAILLLCAGTLLAQSPSFVVVSPQSATLAPGESRSFRLVDQNGRAQSHVTWTVSDPDALQATLEDELTVTAKRSGDFQITGRSDIGAAEATVKVVDGKMAAGTAIWTSPEIAGCKPIQLIEAMPSANGPDMYTTSHCPDGDYVTALTTDGIVLWRRRIGDKGAPKTDVAETNQRSVPTGRIDPHSPSVCDSISTGTGQKAIRDLLHQHHLSFSEGPAEERVWSIEESGSQCKLWFDDKLVLVKKRKVFVVE
jgi:Bacterial Ig-like domain (group 2)